MRTEVEDEDDGIEIQERRKIGRRGFPDNGDLGVGAAGMQAGPQVVSAGQCWVREWMGVYLCCVRGGREDQLQAWIKSLFCSRCEEVGGDLCSGWLKAPEGRLFVGWRAGRRVQWREARNDDDRP